MFGCVMNFKTLYQSLSVFSSAKVPYKAEALWSGYPLQEQFFNIGVLLFQKPADLVGPVFLCTSYLGIDVPPSSKRLAEQKDRTRSLPCVFVVNFGGGSGFGRNCIPDIFEQLLGLLIHTDNGDRFIEGSGMDFRDIFHGANEGGILSWRDAPVFA